MRTQDLNRYELLAKRISWGEEPTPEEIEEVLGATGHSLEELHNRAKINAWRRGAGPRPEAPSKLEEYDRETRVLGMSEGVFICTFQQIVFVVALLALVVLTVLASLT